MGNTSLLESFSAVLQSPITPPRFLFHKSRSSFPLRFSGIFNGNIICTIRYARSLPAFFVPVHTSRPEKIPVPRLLVKIVEPNSHAFVTPQGSRWLRKFSCFHSTGPLSIYSRESSRPWLTYSASSTMEGRSAHFSAGQVAGPVFYQGP